MNDPVYDLLVIGGGINGTGIARDAAGRGLSVILAEKDDLASHTSSASTKLIHGGLRYLENYAFGLVRESLKEREVLLHAAPHIIRPMRFVLPYVKDFRPAWMIRMGLFLYDHLGGASLLPGSESIDLSDHDFGQPLKASIKRGFAYSDCWVDDARLVALNAVDAMEKGAQIHTRTQCMKLVAVEQDGAALWRATLKDTQNGVGREIRARAVANAAGPWVTRMLELAGDRKHAEMRLVKGSHIVVPRLWDADQAYIFQNTDKRVVFAIPYEEDFTLIGTTDIEIGGAPDTLTISDDETLYLCTAVNRYLRHDISPGDVVWSYSGVRPLLDDGSRNAAKVTRDYALELDHIKKAPILSVFGGKITTFRSLAEQATDKLLSCLGRHEPAWTKQASLPGGDIPDADFDGFLADFSARHPFLPTKYAHRLARAYGTRAQGIVDNATGLDGLGRHLGDDLYQAEIDYLRAREWAMTSEDILWRRSKLGLHISDRTRENLESYLTTGV
jgi:glycerol-3-phosphate dehydrogenase